MRQVTLFLEFWLGLTRLPTDWLVEQSRRGGGVHGSLPGHSPSTDPGGLPQRDAELAQAELNLPPREAKPFANSLVPAELLAN